MRLGLVLVLGLGAIGCGNSNAQTHETRGVCGGMTRLCGMEPENRAECSELESELRNTAGKSYPQIAACGTSARTCGELFGCIMQVSVDGVYAMRSLATEPALPGECKRLSILCSPRDARDVGEDCIRMIDNLRLDARNRAKLGTCIDASINCYAAENCIDDLWMELK